MHSKWLMMTGTLMAQVESGVGKWKTWVIPSGNAFRLPARPVYPKTTPA